MAPSADSVGVWLERRDGYWWFSDPRLRDGAISALARTGDFALIGDARIRSGILGYVSRLQADLEEFRREIDGHKEARVRLDIRGELGLHPDLSPDSPREVRLYLGIVSDREGRAALNTLRKSYVNRIWYLVQIEAATTALLDLVD